MPPATPAAMPGAVFVPSTSNSPTRHCHALAGGQMVGPNMTNGPTRRGGGGREGRGAGRGDLGWIEQTGSRGTGRSDRDGTGG